MVTIPKVVLKPKVMQKVQPKRNILLKLKVGKLKYMKKKKSLNTIKSLLMHIKLTNIPNACQIQLAGKFKLPERSKWPPNQNELNKTKQKQKLNITDSTNWIKPNPILPTQTPGEPKVPKIPNSVGAAAAAVLLPFYVLIPLPKSLKLPKVQHICCSTQSKPNQSFEVFMLTSTVYVQIHGHVLTTS